MSVEGRVCGGDTDRVQDRRVCIFKMATNLEGELLACREESGKCELRGLIP